VKAFTDHKQPDKKQAQTQARRPPFQFSLMGLLIVMFVVGAAAAPGYYMFRGGGELRDSWLVGMLMMLAGPLLIMTIISVVLALTGRGRRED
jgi:hypothetical protein